LKKAGEGKKIIEINSILWGKVAQENESFALTISKDQLRSAAFDIVR
jgi:hypothetical protein